jgi:O-antigen/teichoic acid export membrane protein
MPPSFFLGFFFSIYQEGEINWVAIGIASILIIPALWGLFWFTKKYLHLLYGRHLHKLEEMIDHLEND